MNNLFKNSLLALGLCAAAATPCNAEIFAQKIMQNPKTGQVVDLLHVTHGPNDHGQFAELTQVLQEETEPTTVLAELCDFYIDTNLHDVAHPFHQLITAIEKQLGHKVPGCFDSIEQATDFKNLFATFKTKKGPITVVPVDWRDELISLGFASLMALSNDEVAKQMDCGELFKTVSVNDQLSEVRCATKKMLSETRFSELTNKRIERCTALYDKFHSEIFPQFSHPENLSFNPTALKSFLQMNQVDPAQQALPAATILMADLDAKHLADLAASIQHEGEMENSLDIPYEHKQFLTRLDFPALYEILKPTAAHNMVVVAGSLHCENLEKHLTTAGYLILWQSCKNTHKTAFQKILPLLTKDNFELIHPEKLEELRIYTRWGDFII